MTQEKLKPYEVKTHLHATRGEYGVILTAIVVMSDGTTRPQSVFIPDSALSRMVSVFLDFPEGQGFFEEDVHAPKF